MQQETQLKLFEVPAIELPAIDMHVKPFYLALSEGIIDDMFVHLGRMCIALVGMIGLIFILSGAVETIRRNEEIEELIYRRNEDDEIFDEAAKEYGWGRVSKKMISKNHRKMIIRGRWKQRWEADSVWRKGIENELKNAHN